MRDNHEGMLEFIEVFEEDDHFFVLIEHQTKRFQFGISRAGYLAIKKVMQLRPFDMMPGRIYRYFYAGSYKKSGDDEFEMNVRIELDRDATKREITIPKDLHANLLWFARVENIADASYLEIK